MSIVAWHQGKIYSDSCIDGSSDVKVWKLHAERIDSYCGCVGHAADLRNFTQGEGIKHKESVVLQWTGDQLFVNVEGGSYEIDPTRTVAYGSGADFFLGAIAMGCKVTTALSITAQLCNSVAAPFHTVLDGQVVGFPVPKFNMIKELS
ncbi:MAG: hypothetical protein GY776_08820 [Alteromonas sp.]|nr:hypothetical protein [Alteromonas sp.]